MDGENTLESRGPQIYTGFWKLGDITISFFAVHRIPDAVLMAVR